MKSRQRFPTTAAHRFLNRLGHAYENHSYAYIDRGGTRQVALSLAVNEHAVVKTLVMESDDGTPFLVLMHGDGEVSTKRLARSMGAKRVVPCSFEKAQRVTGYQVGGISPFGTRRRLTVYVQASILELDRIYINAGKRGLMLSIQPRILSRCLDCVTVDVLNPAA